MIKNLLWDVDGTLLDFKAAEAYGMKICLQEIGVQLNAEMLASYSAINRSWWEKYERGEVTQEVLRRGRLHDFFAKYCISYTEYDHFNMRYQEALGEAVFPLEDSVRLLQELRPRFRQYIVTNGSKQAQEKKLQKSGINQLADGIFISESIGYQKPSAAFFAAVQAQTGYLQEETLIIGDSLTSDMQGGNNAGILCCWYHPEATSCKKEIRIDYEIRSLWELLKII